MDYMYNGHNSFHVWYGRTIYMMWLAVDIA